MPKGDGDWTALIKLLEELWATKSPQKAYSTLFELLVKYDSNYMECQWDIIHGMEFFGGYEAELVDSLLTKPAGLTLTMLSRLINGGQKQIGATRIDLLLDQVINRADVDEGLIRFAQECKARLKSHQNNYS